jgi:anhydro-N-acetylmuramic acid kinase
MGWLRHPWFRRPLPKSLDREDFRFVLDAVAALTPADGAATLTAFTARAVAFALPLLPAPPRRWLVCGGGRHNPTLMRLLVDGLGAPVEAVEVAGWRGDFIEAEAFAFLAVRAARRLPLSLPSTTGVAQPLTGGTLHRPGRQLIKPTVT